MVALFHKAVRISFSCKKFPKLFFSRVDPRMDSLERLSAVISDFCSFCCYFITLCYCCTRQPCSASLKTQHEASGAHAQYRKYGSMKNNNNNHNSGAHRRVPLHVQHFWLDTAELLLFLPELYLSMVPTS